MNLQMTTMEIKRARAAEAERLTRIAHDSKRHWKYPEQWIAQWQEALTITPDFISRNDVFAALVEGEIIGFYALATEPDRLVLEHLWIAPEYIGRGAGRRLLRHALARAAELKAAAVEIVSDPHAESFYTKMGAVKIGEEVTDLNGAPRILPRLRIEVEKGRTF
jgi:GNAT superfamily N-acetyltransferase